MRHFVRANLELHDLCQRTPRQLITQLREPFVPAPRLPSALFDALPEGIDVHGGTVPGTSDTAASKVLTRFESVRVHIQLGQDVSRSPWFSDPRHT